MNAAATLPMLMMIAGAVGVGLLIRGWRGRRIDDHPVCRKCGYDLHAIASPACCPECGRDLQRRRAMHIGNRRKRRFELAASALLLVPLLLGGGLIGWVMLRGGDLNPHKPLWLLKYEASTVSAAAADAARVEILWRLNNGNLTSEQTQAIIAQAMGAQPDPSRAWHPWWGDFLENAWQRGDVPDETLSQYVRTAVDGAMQLHVRTKVRPGQAFQATPTYWPMRAGTGGIVSIIVTPQVSIVGDNRRYQGMLSVLEFGSGGVAGAGISPGWCCEAVAPTTVGRHHVLVDVRLQAMVRGAGTGTRLRNPIERWETRLVSDFEVVPEDQRIVELVDDPSMAQAIKAATLVDVCSLDDAPRSIWRMRCVLHIDRPPMDVAFDVFARVGDQERKVYDTFARQGLPGALGVYREPDDMFDFEGFLPAGATTVDLILRTSRELAERMPTERVWQGEIVLKDVPFTRTLAGRTRSGFPKSPAR